MIALRSTLRRATERADRAARDADAARARVALLEAALDLVPAGVVVAPAAGGRIRNSTARAMAAARTADALADHAVDELLRDAERGSSSSQTLELHGPPRRTLALFAGPLHDADGAQIGVAAIVEDVTERHQIDAVRRDFIANVSHELRTPIGALSALAETMADQDDAAVVRRLSARIGEETRRAARLVDDLLDLSRIEAAGAGGFEDVDLGDVVRTATERVRMASERAADIQVGELATVHVNGDQSQLVSAVTNLVDNAVKYSDAGTTVTVDVVDDATAARVVVRDRGIGIPRRDLDRIFERFYRVDQARSRATGGTGLGLSIVRHVAENHGGTVHVESTEGEGSTFTITLPKGER